MFSLRETLKEIKELNEKRKGEIKAHGYHTPARFSTIMNLY